MEKLLGSVATGGRNDPEQGAQPNDPAQGAQGAPVEAKAASSRGSPTRAPSTITSDWQPTSTRRTAAPASFATSASSSAPLPGSPARQQGASRAGGTQWRNDGPQET